MTHKPDEGTCVFGAMALSRHLQALQGEIEGVRLAEDIECVHRMRVASRRLRSTLPRFADCYPEKRMRVWTAQIKAITRALGAARDADVQLEALQAAWVDLSDPAYQPGLRRLSLRLRQHRANLQGDLIQALDRYQSSGAGEDLAKHVAPFLTRQQQTYLFCPSLYQLGFESISQDLHALLTYEPYVNQPECVSELHAMRIAAKHLRYSMEIFSSLYPAELKNFLQVMRKLQEQLGDIHDNDVWGMMLPDFLNQERDLTRRFYGHLRGFRRIEPGIQALAAHQKQNRDKVYQQFTVYWQKITAENTWQNLINATQIPFFLGETANTALQNGNSNAGKPSE